MDLSKTPTDREQLLVVDAEYSMESHHQVPAPVVHLRCRNTDRELREITVEGFRPYFYVGFDEFADDPTNVYNDRHVVGVEADLRALVSDYPVDGPDELAEYMTNEATGPTTVYHDPDAFTALDGTGLVRVLTVEPSHVGKIRDYFDRTWEADIPFTRRFLISSGIYLGCTVPSDSERVRYENWAGGSDSSRQVREIRPADPPESVRPRITTVDIEVATHGGGVPDPDEAPHEITAVTAHDNYTDEYAAWVLESDEWSEKTSETIQDDVLESAETELSIGLDTIRAFDHEGAMLEDIATWLVDRNFDMFTGWNCIPGTEPVLRADGTQVPIKDISEGDTVIGIDDDEAVTATVTEHRKTGVKDTVRIETKHGDDIRCTPEHEVLVGNERDIEWKRAGEIESGEFVLDVKNIPSEDIEPDISIDRVYQYGLIAADGHLAYDEGVRFYNKRDELHDQFDTGNTVSETVDGTKSQRVFTNVGRNDAVQELDDVGIPAGSKKDGSWDLSTIFQWDESYIAAFLAGFFDGDGTVASTPSISATNESCRYWLQQLFGRLGIWTTESGDSVFVSGGSRKRFVETVCEYTQHTTKTNQAKSCTYTDSSREDTIPGYIATGGEDTAGDGSYRRVNEYLSREDVSLKRHHATSVGSDHVDEYTDFVFDRVVGVYEDETAVCYDITTTASSYISNGSVVHNCNWFDYPYLINRCYEKSAYGIRDLTPFGNPGAWRDDRDQLRLKMDGVVPFDMLNAYKKTQFRELSSYRLDDVAQAELGMGKTDIDDDLDDAWHKNPIEFMVYNVRDVQAVVEIEASSQLIDLFNNLREVTGAGYDTCNHNGPMIDTLFLRQAYEDGIALPTNQSVPAAEGKYHGARVFDPEPGVHENCVYPDLSSMYPNLFYMLNLGSETIVGDEQDLAESEWTEDDVIRAPIDWRDFATVPKGESYSNIDRSEYKGVLSADGGVREMFEPQYDDLYVLKPGIRESFIRNVIDDLIEMKNNYSGAMYGAVKRVTNSVYGVVGDSESGGKGFRIFDRRVAEAITMAGRRVITFTANEFTQYINDHYDPDARVVGGDTDSATSTTPNANSYGQTYRWATDAIEFVESEYDEFVQNEFAFDPDMDHRLAVELESVASALFYMRDLDADRPHETAVKKRYAQHLVWNDDDGWIDLPDVDETDYDVLEDPDDRSELKQQNNVNYETYSDRADGILSDRNWESDISITGFEFVRSDAAIVTKEAQRRLLGNALIADDPSDRIYEYMNQLTDDISSGEYPVYKLGRPKGISKDLDDYGWKTVEELAADSNYVVTDEDEDWGGRYVSTPGPTYRGAKYANDHFVWEDIDGGKPVRFYIETVRGDEYPAAYEYDDYPKGDRPDSPEVGRPVDAIAVNKPDKIPEEFVFDREKMMEKELRDKVEAILETVGESWDGIVPKGRQSGLDAFV